MANNPTEFYLDRMAIEYGCNFLAVYYVASISKWADKTSGRIGPVNSYSWLSQVGSYTIKHFLDQYMVCVNADGS